MRYSSFLLLAGIASTILPLPLYAADRFWDINDAIAGAGGLNPNGFWDGQNWSISPAGVDSTGFWNAPSDTAIFAAGTDAAGAYTVTLNTAQTAAGLILQEGNLSLAGAALAITTVTIEAGARLSIPSAANLVAEAGAVLHLNGGAFRNTSNAPGAIFADADFTINVGAAGGTVEVINTGANSTLYTGTIAGAGNTLTKTGPGEFRFQGARMANSTFSKLVVNEGLYRLGNNAGNNFETGFGAVPATFTPDAITLSGGGAIGTSWAAADSVLHANRGITLGTGGGALLGNLAVPGAISGSGGLSTTTTIVLTGTNTFTGGTLLNSGVLNLGTANTASGAILASSGIVINTGTLALQNAAGNADRLGDSIPVTLNGSGSAISLTGNAAANTTEMIGLLGMNAGGSTVTIGSAAGRVTTLNTPSFSRGGNHATALIRGTNLTQDAATNVARFVVGDAGASLALVGTATLNNGAVNDATKALKIVPYLFGDSSISGTGNGFVTYDTALGFRVLNTAQTTPLASDYTTAANPDNATVGANVVLGGNSEVTVNSLLFKTAASILSSDNAIPLTIASGALATSGSFDYTIANKLSGVTLGNGEGIITVAANTLSIHTPLSVTNNGGLTKAGGGTLILTTANNHAGGTRINGGIVQIDNAAALGSGSVAMHGTRLVIKNGLTLGNPLSIGANTGVAARGLLEPVDGNATVSGPITITSNAASTSGHFAAPSGSLTIEGMITAPPSVTVTSRLGSVTFSGGGAGYSNLQIQGGSAFIGADNGIATSAIVDIASIDTATLDLNGFDQTLAGLARTLNSTTRTATITNAGPVNKTLTLHVATSAAYGGTIETANTTGNALITGNLSLVKTGPGIQSISGGGDNTYTGSTTINGGILRLQKEAGTIAIPAGNFVAIGNGGTLQLGQSSLIHDGITAFTIDGGTFDLASFVEGIIPALTITNATVSGSSAGFLLARGGFIGTGTNLISKGISVRGFDPNSGRFAIASGVTTVSGSIQTDGANAAQGIIKTGEGTLILSGANSYTGPTLLSGGTTIVSGSLAAASAVTVGNAVNPAMVAILAGSGSVGGVGIVGSGNPLTTGASLSPGNSGGVAGILSTASLSLTAGAHLDLQIGGITAGGEAGYDQVIASGAVNLTGADLKLTLQGTASFHAGDLLYLIANNSASAVTGAFATVNGNPFDPSNILLEGRHFQLTYTANFTGANSDNMANDVALIAVPEPRAWLTMLAGLGLLIGRRRRDK